MHLANGRSSRPAVLVMRMQPSWVFVDDIRRFVESFCAATCPAAAREEQLALAAHELVQNAIANATSPGIELRLELDGTAERVRLSVTNSARPEQVAELRSRLARVSAHDSPLAGYLDAMSRAPEARGGLGLARIRFEAALELDVDVDLERERVTVHAAGPLTPPSPAAAVEAARRGDGTPSAAA